MVYAPHWYDLYSLFNKAFGEFSVNVQGLSRVRRSFLHLVSPPNVLLLQGMFPLKAFYWGHKGARDNFSLQIRTLKEEAHKSLGDIPVLFGECGIPLDMKYAFAISCLSFVYDFLSKGEAFVTDDFIWQKRMMDALITAMDHSLVGFK
jgi:hypothetical protein